MALYQIKKTDNRFYYRLGSQWKALPKEVEWISDIEQFFESGKNFADGNSCTFDKPQIEFVNDSGKPVNLFEVTREGDKTFICMNLSKKDIDPVLRFDESLTDKQLKDYLQKFSKENYSKDADINLVNK